MRTCILWSQDPLFPAELRPVLLAGGYHVHFARSSAAARRFLKAAGRAVLMLDLGPRSRSSILKALPMILQRSPQTRVLAWVDRGDRPQALQALQFGAGGCLEKGSSREKILRALDEIRAGGHPLSDSLFRALVERVAERTTTETMPLGRGTPVSPDALSPREAEIYSYLCHGYSNKGIAAKIDLTLDAVRYHLKHLYRKLKVNSRTEAVVRCLANGAPHPSSSFRESPRTLPKNRATHFFHRPVL